MRSHHCRDTQLIGAIPQNAFIGRQKGHRRKCEHAEIISNVFTDLVVISVISLAVMGYYANRILAPLLQDRSKHDAMKQKRKILFERLHLPATLQLTYHEELIAAEVIHPDDIDASFSSVGGHEAIIESLKETIVAPLCHAELFLKLSQLLNAPKGVLFYGPPGLTISPF